MSRNPVEGVVNTSHSVSYFKRSAVDKGYYEDDFIRFFSSPSEETPTLNMCKRGIYLRVTVIRRLIDAFFKSVEGQRVQFVNLGCGLDPTSFHLLSKYDRLCCFDLDFPHHLRQKVHFMEKSNGFSFLNYTLVDGLVQSQNYKMVPIDFECVEDLGKLEASGISRDLPTLFLSEFCLTYVENEHANKVIKYLAEYSKQPLAYVFIDYTDQIGSWTKFGKWYSGVFKDFHAEFKSLLKYDTLELHTNRYLELGWESAFVNPMTYTWNNLISKEDRDRIRALEQFNDFEEIGTWGNHTVIGVAFNGKEKLEGLRNLYDGTKFKGRESEYPDFIPYTVGYEPDKFDLESFKKTLQVFIVKSNN